MAIHPRDKLPKPTFLDRAADVVAKFTGSWWFILLHTVWFGAWLLFRLDINLLTLVVSLEAIYLATILLMASNRQEQKDNARDDADFDADVQAEREIRAVKRQLERIEQRLQR